MSNIAKPQAIMTIRANRRAIFGWTLLAGVLVFGAMCVPFFLGRVYTADDLGEFHLPIRDYYSRQLAAGESWDWMPSLFCGFYLTGEGQLGGYHPLHLLLYRMLPLGAAFDLELLLSYPFIAMGTYLFLRRIVARRDAAAFGSLIFTFSSFNLLHFVHPNAIAVVAHLPWLLWAIDIACQTNVRRTKYLALCLIALLTGSQLLLGYPQYVWFSMLCEVFYAAFRLRRNPLWLQRAGGLILATTLGVLIGAVQVLPTADALANSTRSSVDTKFRTSGSLHPLNVIQPLAPYLLSTRVVGQNTHELSLYFGAVPLVLCFWLWVDRKNWGRWARLIWPTIALTVLALLYAFGEFSPIYGLQSWLPAVGSFRFPCRAVVLVELGIAVLSAIAFLRLSRPSETASRAIFIPAVISLLLAASAPILFANYASTPLLVAMGPVLILLATLLIFHQTRGARWAQVALVLLAAGDLAAYGLSYAVMRRTEDLNQFARSASRPPLPSDGRLAVNTGLDDPNVRYGNRLLLAGYSLADGYAGLEPARSDSASSQTWLRQAGVDWKRSGQSWLPLGNHAPLVQFNNQQAHLHVTRRTAETIQVSTDAPKSETLLVSESFHSGWVARLDGQIIPIVRTKTGFMECAVPAGHHTLELRFQPASLRIGFLLTTCGLGLTMSLAAFALRYPLSPEAGERGVHKK